MLEQRDQWDCQADGIVIKVDDLAQQRTLGNTGHEPRWAVAWKFPSERVATRLEAISVSVGRFGKLTPVAELASAAVGGVVARHASLHNADYVARRNLRPGDLVTIERAGDVIPQVLAPIDAAPNRANPVWTMPDRCPACAEPVDQEDDAAAHWCVNHSCPSRLPEALRHFVSKRAMDIDGLGERWC